MYCVYIIFMTRIRLVRRICGKEHNQQDGQRVMQSMQAQDCDITQEVTSQDPAADMVSIAPAQEQSSQTDIQECQRDQDQRASVPISGLCYLPPLGQGLL